MPANYASWTKLICFSFRGIAIFGCVFRYLATIEMLVVRHVYMYVIYTMKVGEIEILSLVRMILISMGDLLHLHRWYLSERAHILLHILLLHALLLFKILWV